MPVSPISQGDISTLAAHASKENPLVIVPHDNPDVDAVVSATMMHVVLSRLGIPSYVCLRTPPDDITRRIIQDNSLLFPDTDVLISSIPENAALVLTDWFSVPDASNHVVAVFDHHPTTQKIHADIVEEHRYNAATKLVYDLFCADAPAFDDIREELVRNVLFTVFVDSNSMKSTRFIAEDLPWIESQIQKYGFDRNAMTQAGYSLNDLTEPVSKLVRNGEKRYNLPNGRRGYISYIMVADYDRRLDKEIEKEMKRVMEEEQADCAWYMICDLGRDETHIFKLDKHNEESEPTWETHHANLSRATDVYPVMEAENS